MSRPLVWILWGLGALRDALKSWPGALVVVSHDRDFIESIDVRCEIRLE